MSSTLPLESQTAEDAQSAASNDAIRVLIVDDDPAFRRLCSEYLKDERTTCYELSEVDCGETAMEHARSNEFDCILIDYRLPDTSGTGLMRRLHSEEHISAPMIMLTSVGNEDIAMEAVHGGAADYIPKHRVSQQSLHRAIRNAVRTRILHRSIQERTEKLQAANEELVRKNDQIQRFYHTVSHEIKTPLTAAREFIALVFDGVMGETSAEQKETLSYAIDSCDQIAAHFNDLIESTRLDIGKLQIKKKMERVETMLRRSVVSVLPTIEAKSIKLVQTIDEALPELEVDGSRIVQVLSNLLSNALKYTDSGGRIEVSAVRDDEGENVILSVADSGCGIAPEHLPRIFDRLYQVESGGDGLMGSGLGLGLSIAKEIVRLHGGSIDVTSEVGGGSQFRVTLPTALPGNGEDHDTTPESGMQ